MPRARGRAAKPRPARDVTSRLDHAGKWLAWAEDESRIVAVGETMEEVRGIAEGAGHPRFIYDWVPPIEARQTSGPA